MFLVISIPSSSTREDESHSLYQKVRYRNLVSVMIIMTGIGI